MERIPGFKEIGAAMGMADLAKDLPDAEVVEALTRPDGGTEVLASELAEGALDEPPPEGEGADEAVDLPEGTQEEEEGGPLAESLHVKVRSMNLPSKIRLAIVGNATARALLINDRNRVVCESVLENPGLTLKEVSQFARNKNLSEDIIRRIATKREWVRAYQVKLALLFNPKTPAGAAGRFLRFMRRNDLKAIGRSRDVPRPVARAAQEEIRRREQPGK